MAYTVKQISKLSGVSIRTLHWYDEIGLLKPAYYGSNGYRYYEEEQLLTLQQVLFFRELGMELKRIQKILGRSDFDKIAALGTHRKVLLKDLEKTKALIKTIDKTIEHLKGTKKMKKEDIFSGFSKEKQAEYERQIIERFGEQGKKHIEESKQNVKKWSKSDLERIKQDSDRVCRDLTALLEEGAEAGSDEVKKVISRHFQCLKQFWTPNKETYAAHGQLILESDLKKFYEAYHAELPEFIAEGIQEFAKTEL